LPEDIFMKTHIAIGSLLLLTLGSAAAGTYLYGQGQSEQSTPYFSEPVADSQAVTPEMMAMWKMSASSTHYIAPKAPI
jgi:hypothetical protein